jgi:hypothetical protein
MDSTTLSWFSEESHANKGCKDRFEWVGVEPGDSAVSVALLGTTLEVKANK